MDLPFAQARWRVTGRGHRILSAHRSEQFGRDYGVLIKEWRLLQRAVFVIDGSGRISYAEHVADQMAEPDYQRAMEAVQAASQSTVQATPRRVPVVASRVEHVRGRRRSR
jgi:thioredoxin-dependent peroxiredoxin